MSWLIYLVKSHLLLLLAVSTLSDFSESVNRDSHNNRYFERKGVRTNIDLLEDRVRSNHRGHGGLRAREARESPSVDINHGLTERWAVIGGEVSLPCPVSASANGEAPLLITISRDEKPIYSVDARKSDGDLSTAVHWSSPSLLGGRGQFLLTGGGALKLRSILPSDKMDYHCRVEFSNSPTRNSRVRLQIVVSPSVPVIFDKSGNVATGTIGPFSLGSTIELLCRVRGGYPRPQVSWWHEEFLLDSVSEETVGPTTLNRMSLPNLSRQHLHRKLTCEAKNSNLTEGVRTSVVLNMSFPPSSVSVEGKAMPWLAGNSYRLKCHATGSRPAATLQWYKDGAAINTTSSVSTKEEGTTESVLQLLVSPEDNGRIIVCRGTNPLMPKKYKEDTRLLNVHFAPEFKLRLGSNLNVGNIKEFDDVYFECSYLSNPHVTNLLWYRNEVEVREDKSKGIILSNRSLVLQKIPRDASGNYSCRGSNGVGSATSATLRLMVQYAPTCSPLQQTVYGGGRREPVNITCRVESHPPPTSFKWSLNTSSADVVEIPSSRSFTQGHSSVLAYTPHTPLDYGALLCQAKNSVGWQMKSCIYQVVPAAIPESVVNCSAWHNISASGEVVVWCAKGWDGGLRQSFTLEVLESDTGERVASRENDAAPQFTITGLMAGKEYFLRVTSVNSQGAAPAVTISHLTPIDIAEKRLSKTPHAVGGMGIHTVLGVLAGVLSVLILCCVAAVLILKARNSQANSKANTPVTKLGLDPSNTDDNHRMRADRDPDVINVSPDVRDDEQLLQIHKTKHFDSPLYVSEEGVMRQNPVCPSDLESYIDSDAYSPTPSYDQMISSYCKTLPHQTGYSPTSHILSTSLRRPKANSQKGTPGFPKVRGPPGIIPNPTVPENAYGGNMLSPSEKEGHVLRVEHLKSSGGLGQKTGRNLPSVGSPQRESIV